MHVRALKGDGNTERGTRRCAEAEEDNMINVRCLDFVESHLCFEKVPDGIAQILSSFKKKKLN